MTRTVDLIAGARPNFMKIAPIVDAMAGSSLTYRIVHTGQHYDRAMSQAFFEQLGIPEPHVNLGVGSGTQAEQTAAIMVGYERLLMEAGSDLCVVVGDVNSTLACAVSARKMGVPVAHVEGGIRSGDWSMPEEINRVATDSISNWFFTTSEFANRNLRDAGVGDDRIFFVGNTMIDTLLKQLPRLRAPACWDALGLKSGAYLTMTLHRPNNVDDPAKLRRLLEAVAAGADGLPVVFPVHPRTRRNLADIPGIHAVEPLGYLEFNYLVKHAKGVITDSGGVTEETTVLGVPCMTLRDSTERPETVTVGTNELLGTDPSSVGPALARLREGRWKAGGVPDRWDGHAAERIVAELERLLG